MFHVGPNKDAMLSVSQMESLRGIVDALMPSLPNLTEIQNENHDRFWNINISENNFFMDSLILALTTKLSSAELLEVRLLLTALSTTLGSVLLFATATTSPFSSWNTSDRSKALNKLRTSRLVDKRKAFNGLKRLICGISLSFIDETGNNPFWAAMGYPGPLKDSEKFLKTRYPSESPNSFINLSDLQNNQLEFDCIIVGSGAGGSVAAYNISKAGYSVLVIEKGDSPDVKHFEAAAFETMYEKAGLLTTVDGNISILAASVLGGGPSINWSCCIETPWYVRKEWVEKHGLTDFRRGGDFDESLEYILNRIEAKNDHVVHNGMNRVLLDGLKSRSIDFDVTKQNLKNTSLNSAGYICFGDRSGNKRCVLKTFLSDAVNNGIKILTNARVERVLNIGKKASGVEILFNDIKYKIKAKRCVILSAGSLRTPCVMKCSGFMNRNIGQHLHLHPVAGVAGTFKNKQVHGYLGAPMTIACKEFCSGVYGDGYGPILECPSIHTGLAGASAFLWSDPNSFRKSALSLNSTSAIIVLQRDKGEGKVDVDAEGNPRIYYMLDKVDEENIVQGIKESAKTLIAAGCSDVYISGIKEICYSHCNHDKVFETTKEFEQFVKDLEETGVKPHEIGLFSAHQMGTARLSVNPDVGAVSEDGESWDCENLYVFDASTFPTASGANPMCTTLAISHMLSKRLAHRLLYEDQKIEDKCISEKMRQILRLREAKRVSFNL